ncbi:unnamed protein product [Notodromas monacha]|uniref:Uncharacterized protein n=1 Tax=Notodromas monacha TaxID=399045 RepID=A0A7R9BQ09_9CRUS|nr:unnamed protein product [Notodromas monacha]CAG0918467.1 unnamed protein product [Notodromas monacha]
MAGSNYTSEDEDTVSAKPEKKRGTKTKSRDDGSKKMSRASKAKSEDEEDVDGGSCAQSGAESGRNSRMTKEKGSKNSGSRSKSNKGSVRRADEDRTVSDVDEEEEDAADRRQTSRRNTDKDAKAADIPDDAEPSEVLGLGAVVPRGSVWNVPTEVCVGDKYVVIGRCPTGTKPVAIDLWAPYPKDKAISVKMFMGLCRFQISAKCDGKPKACTCPAKGDDYPFEKDKEFKIIIAVTKDNYVVKFYGTRGQGVGTMKHVLPVEQIDTFSITNAEMIFKALKYC